MANHSNTQNPTALKNLKAGTPNFSVILPGKCNCRCEFCFWKYEQSPEDWLVNLIDTIHLLPKEYTRCSISGGEPTLSPVFDQVVDLISAARNWEAIVLTTNATLLDKKLDAIENINHLNISRHHYLESKNAEIFKTKSIPNQDQLFELCRKVNDMGIDVNINCVLVDQFKNAAEVEEFIMWCKNINVQSICFRQDQALNSTDMPKEMKWFDHIKSVEGWSCEVCKIYQQIICGMKVNWKAAYAEPSIETGEVYELVYHQNGVLSSDWNCKNRIVLKKCCGDKKDKKEKPSTQKDAPKSSKTSGTKCWRSPPEGLDQMLENFQYTSNGRCSTGRCH